MARISTSDSTPEQHARGAPVMAATDAVAILVTLAEHPVALGFIMQSVAACLDAAERQRLADACDAMLAACATEARKQ